VTAVDRAAGLRGGPDDAPSLPLSPVPDDAAEGDDDRVDANPGASARGLIPQLSQELATLRGRVDLVQSDVGALVARLHTLGEAISGVESALSDRLSEYADTVVQLGRGLTSNVSTYREGNERTVAELRRALADSEELLRAVLTKADDLAVEIASVRSGFATESPSDALDVDELRTVLHEALEPFDVRAAIDRLGVDVAALHERVSASLETDALADAPASAPAVDSALQAEVLAGLEAVRAELQRLRRVEERASKSDATAAREQALVAELQAMRDEITQLKRRIAVRAKPATIDDGQLAALATQITAAVDLRLPDAELQRLADAVAQRFTEAFEVVPEDS
jgi:hypothetical protein